MFRKLQEISRRPEPFEICTVADLWTDEHISKRMLEMHLDPESGLASRKKEFVERSADWIADRAGVGEGMRICDFGCGPGLYAARWAERGALVTGVDFSPRSIDYARTAAAQKGLEIEYQLQNYLDFSSDTRFDLMTMIFVDLCALSPEQREVVYGRFRDHLEDDGVAILDVLSLNHYETVEEASSYEFCEGGGFWSPVAHYVFLNVFKYAREKLLLYKNSVVEERRTRVVYNWLQCFSMEMLESEMRECGLQVEDRYSDLAGAPFDAKSPEMAVVVRKL